MSNPSLVGIHLPCMRHSGGGGIVLGIISPPDWNRGSRIELMQKIVGTVVSIGVSITNFPIINLPTLLHGFHLYGGILRSTTMITLAPQYGQNGLYHSHVPFL